MRKTEGMPNRYLAVGHPRAVKIVYSAEIASVGHTPTHAPQSMHFSASMKRALSFSEIAPTGHSLSQEPQLMQASLILRAIYLSYMIQYIKRFHTFG